MQSHKVLSISDKMNSIWNIKQRRKKCPNLRTRFAENIWALEVSQKILAENHALCNQFLMIQRLVKYMVWQKIFCQWQILKSYFLWQNLLWLCRKGTTLYFSVLKIFCRPKTSYLKFWLFSAQSKIFLWPFGLKWYHKKCWQKFVCFLINFNNTNNTNMQLYL